MFLFHFYWLGQRPVMTIYVSVLDHYVFFFVVETNNENSFIKIHQLTLNVWCFTTVQNSFLCHNSNLNFEYGVSNSSTQKKPFITSKSLCAQPSLNVGNYLRGKEIPYFTTSNQYTLSWISFVHSAPLHLIFVVPLHTTKYYSYT